MTPILHLTDKFLYNLLAYEPSFVMDCVNRKTENSAFNPLAAPRSHAHGKSVTKWREPTLDPLTPSKQTVNLGWNFWKKEIEGRLSLKSLDRPVVSNFIFIIDRL